MSLKLETKKRNKSSSITALIDGDIICYSCGFSAQHNIHTVTLVGEDEPRASFQYKKDMKLWVESEELDLEEYTVDTRIEVEPVENALHSVKLFINDIMEKTDAQYHKIYLTGKGNFRDTVATILPYKGNRDNLTKPAHYQAIRDYLIERWDAGVVEGMEADDMLAIEQTRDLSVSESKMVCDTIICSIDKDLRQVPGWHYNWNKEEKPVWVSEEEGVRNLYKQAITGDSVDNIPGLSEKRPKKRTFSTAPIDRLRAECDMYEYVLEGYVEKYGEGKAVKALHENMHLLFMIRELDKDGQPIHWRPPA